MKLKKAKATSNISVFRITYQQVCIISCLLRERLLFFQRFYTCLFFTAVSPPPIIYLNIFCCVHGGRIKSINIKNWPSTKLYSATLPLRKARISVPSGSGTQSLRTGWCVGFWACSLQVPDLSVTAHIWTEPVFMGSCCSRVMWDRWWRRERLSCLRLCLMSVRTFLGSACKKGNL